MDLRRPAQVPGPDAQIPPSQWEETDCLLCGSPERSTLLPAPPGNLLSSPAEPSVVRCRACGFSYTSPRPTVAAVGRLYSEDYAPHRVRRIEKPSRWTAWRRKIVGRLTPGPDALLRHGKGRLLDFGCGGGAFLQKMTHLGWNVLGVDASQPVVEAIRTELELPALAGDLWAPDLDSARFDLIAMRQSLEHVHAPLDVLRRARELLVPGGRLLISVPNIQSLPYRWFGPDWFGLELPRHLSHFSPATLRDAVARAGLQVDAVWMTPHASWIQKSARLARRENRGHPGLRLLAWRPVCRWVARYCRLRGQADCIALAATKPARLQ